VAAKEDPRARRKRAGRILARLAKAYPDARCMLDYRDPLQLLVATILAAQCTDERVNRVTPAIFAKYRGPADYAGAPTAALEQAVHPTGFFRNKTRAIQACCRAVLEQHGGAVPDTMDALCALPGVGRKTANVLLGECFGKPGIIVDTHVKRVATRLGLTAQKHPDKIEADLDVLIPAPKRTIFSHALTFHGRQVCDARKPRCEDCAVRSLCPFPG
jgi:endonuclease-3